MKDNNDTSGIVVILICVGLVMVSVQNIMQAGEIADLSSRLGVLEMKE